MQLYVQIQISTTKGEYKKCLNGDVKMSKISGVYRHRERHFDVITASAAPQRPSYRVLCPMNESA